jgi:hypothetical protein
MNIFTHIARAKRQLIQNVLDGMPTEARDAYEHANNIFRACAESGEPQTRTVPATVTIETSAGVNRPQEQPKDIVNEMVAAMRRVTGLDR